jgi:hypothetical protein
VGRFPNPGRGSRGYRTEAAFFRLCGEVRALMTARMTTLGTTKGAT